MGVEVARSSVLGQGRVHRPPPTVLVLVLALPFTSGHSTMALLLLGAGPGWLLGAACKRAKRLDVTTQCMLPRCSQTTGVDTASVLAVCSVLAGFWELWRGLLAGPRCSASA